MLKDELTSQIIDKEAFKTELATHFNIDEKQMGDYIRKLEKMDYVIRHNTNKPRPIFPTLAGMKNYYCQIMTKCPEILQSQIEKYVSQIEKNYIDYNLF